MNTIYVITRGSYSDYHICAVASTQERAEQLQKMYSRYDEMADIEEYKIDVPSDEYFTENPTPYWKIEFNENGSLINAESFYDSPNLPIKIKEKCWSFNAPLTIINIQADTQEKAMKIAYDKRAQYLAEKFGL